MFYQIAACLILAVFYGCYYGKLLLQRRQGIRTDQLGVGKQGIVKWVEILTKVVAIIMPVAQLVSMVCSVADLPGWLRATGLVLCVMGTTVFICAVVTMRDNWRAGVSKTDRTELVTVGIYAISRNPAFLGFDLVYIGMACIFCNPLLWGLTCFAVLVFHLQIVNVEEDHLLDVYGEAYRAYRKKVNRYLGRK